MLSQRFYREHGTMKPIPCRSHASAWVRSQVGGARNGFGCACTVARHHAPLTSHRRPPLHRTGDRDTPAGNVGSWHRWLDHGCSSRTRSERSQRRLGRCGCAATPISMGTAQVSVTASFGVTALKCLPGSEDCADQLFRRADRAMYISKEAGRNRVNVVADS